MKKILLVTSLLFFITACGEGASSIPQNPPLDKISNETKVFTIEDFKNVGFKVNKEYDVSELESSTGAWYGFWKNDLGKALDFEIRIYPSQQLILNNGLRYADEVIGDGAILKKSLSSWKEGIKERRIIKGNLGGNTVRAKYLDYVVYGNVIILCTGLDLTYAIQNCSDLVDSTKK